MRRLTEEEYRALEEENRRMREEGRRRVRSGDTACGPTPHPTSLRSATFPTSSVKAPHPSPCGDTFPSRGRLAGCHLPHCGGEGKSGKAFGGPAGQAKGKRQKYGNRRVEVDGMKFDSEHEAAAWAELLLRVRAGELKCVLRQVGFDLPGGIRYIADFVAVDRENRITVLDAKSEITRKNRVYINKKKQMARCLGFEIVEI